jgi:hypothetical protein
MILEGGASVLPSSVDGLDQQFTGLEDSWCFVEESASLLFVGVRPQHRADALDRGEQKVSCIGAHRIAFGGCSRDRQGGPFGCIVPPLPGFVLAVGRSRS